MFFIVHNQLFTIHYYLNPQCIGEECEGIFLNVTNLAIIQETT